MCLTRMREVAWSMARTAKNAGAIVVVHGSDSTDNPELFLNNGFDYVLCGEAEEVLAELCAALLCGKVPPRLDGLVQRSKAGHIMRSQQKLARNPAWVH